MWSLKLISCENCQLKNNLALTTAWNGTITKGPNWAVYLSISVARASTSFFLVPESSIIPCIPLMTSYVPPEICTTRYACSPKPIWMANIYIFQTLYLRPTGVFHQSSIWFFPSIKSAWTKLHKFCMKLLSLSRKQTFLTTKIIVRCNQIGTHRGLVLFRLAEPL